MSWRLWQPNLIECPKKRGKITCHALGVKDIPRITAILELANRECIILSDDDSVAKQYQKEYNGYGKWMRYSEILPLANATTGEDFIKPEAFNGIIKNILQQYPVLTELTEDQMCDTHGKIYSLNSWMIKAGIEEQDRKVIINQIKENVFNELKVSQIEENYFELLKQLAEKL